MSQREDEKIAFWCGAIFGLITTGFCLCVVIAIANFQWRHDAVKHGAAEYDQKTGEWRWKVKVEDE